MILFLFLVMFIFLTISMRHMFYPWRILDFIYCKAFYFFVLNECCMCLSACKFLILYRCLKPLVIEAVV